MNKVFSSSTINSNMCSLWWASWIFQLTCYAFLLIAYLTDPDLGLRGVVVGASQGLPEETHHLGVDLGPPEGHHQETDQGQELGPDLSPQWEVERQKGVVLESRITTDLVLHLCLFFSPCFDWQFGMSSQNGGLTCIHSSGWRYVSKVTFLFLNFFILVSLRYCGSLSWVLSFLKVVNMQLVIKVALCTAQLLSK